MTEATKSVLLVDYDSIHRSLSAGDSGAAERLASRLGSWIGAIEVGSLFADKAGPAGRRRVLIRRCYADPDRLGNDRAAFLANGFQVVDCPPIEGREHNTATIHIVLDCIDSLEHPTGYEEFILLSADSDLSPLLIRLRAHNRATAIYANMASADSYRAIADAVIEEPRFIVALLSDEEPAVEDEEEPEDVRPADRSEIEALARKISSATNVPLFAPRTFADLFRHLVEEIAENGYHFQSTAENVATRMADAGRNVSRRQVVFVVKGLALKGHVFSTGDTPDRLADVFREQVLYLAESAGLALDDTERRVLSSWIVGQVSPSAGPRDGESQKSSARPAGGDEGSTAKSASGQAGRASRRRPPKPAGGSKPTDEAKSAEPPKSSTTTNTVTPPAPSKEAAPQQEGAAPKSPPSQTESKTASTDSDDAPEKPARSSGAGPSSARSTTATKPASPRPAAAARASNDENDTDAVENSILAAIAEAVDVLVEDSGGKSKPAAEPGDTKSRTAERIERATKTGSEAAAGPTADEDSEGDDIGDEIQRIIASYSRNRNKDVQ